MSSSQARRVMAIRDSAIERMGEESSAAMQIDVLQESMRSLVDDLLRIEDEGWASLTGAIPHEQKGLTLADLNKLVPHIERQTKVLGDLLGRGLRLKNNHVFGRGFVFERGDGDVKIQPRIQAVIDDPENKAEVFSPTAMKLLNRIFFTSGNLIARYDKKDKKVSVLSIDRDIENFISYDRDQSKLKYILHKWTTRDDLTGKGKETTHREWVPVSTYAATTARFPATIKVGNEDVAVAKDSVMVVQRVNRDNGDVWGVPDAFAAVAPATVYADYLKSGAKLQHALAAISFVVKAKTQAAAKAAGAKLQNGRVGQAAITGPETEVSSLPRAGSIDLYEGRPLAARVASALDVSTTGITADPGTGGSYASENALSAPEQMSALSRQEDFSNFFGELFRVIGAPDVKVNWNRLDLDPVHRQMQGLSLARTLGGISQEEFRMRSLELLDIVAIGHALPEPDEFTGSKYATLRGQIDAGLVDDPDPDQVSDDPNPRQGNSGAVGSITPDNDMRDSDRDAGTA